MSTERLTSNQGPVHPAAQPAWLAVRPRRPEPTPAEAEPTPADPQVRPEGPGRQFNSIKII